MDGLPFSGCWLQALLSQRDSRVMGDDMSGALAGRNAESTGARPSSTWQRSCCGDLMTPPKIRDSSAAPRAPQPFTLILYHIASMGKKCSPS